MTYDQFKVKLRAAGLTVRELAALLDMRPNSITNYRTAGTVPRHLAVIVTLAAAVAERGADVAKLLSDDSRGL